MYLALLPQFIDAGGRWPVAVQAGLLGTLHMADCAARPRCALDPAERGSGGHPHRRAMMTVIGGLPLLERLAH